MQITNCGQGVHRREVVGIERLRRLPNDWYCFTNLDLALGPGRSREIDVILVAPDRIFLIDLKDWHGRIESSNGAWLHNGVDKGASPVGKIHQNAKEVARLLVDHLKRHAKKALPPRVVGLVVVTGSADLSGIAATEQGSVFPADAFIDTVSNTGKRIATFGAVAMNTPLTDVDWKDQLSKFFNARTGPLRPGRRRYGGFVAASDKATFEHARRIYAEYDAVDENAAHNLGTLRVWDFSKAEARFQTEEARREIAGRERAVVDYLRDRSDACETAILQPKLDDPDRGVSYWEIFDRRQRLKRLSEFASTEAEGLSPERRVELARQMIARVATLHGANAAHLDLGGHSVWLEAPSSVRLSHLMAAQFAQVQSLGANRYQFLSSAELPEDVLGEEAASPRQKDVFLLAVAVHWLLFGAPPAAAAEAPFDWSPAVDGDGAYTALHAWFARALAWDPADRFQDATEALDGFNAATLDRPDAREVLEGLERFRGAVRSQRQLFTAFPETASLREGDRLDVWRSEQDGEPVLVKMWKRAAWGDQVREGPRILDFLNRARDLILSPPAACGRVLEVHWLGDAIVLVQRWEAGVTLAEAMTAGQFGEASAALQFAARLANIVTDLHGKGVVHGDLKPQNIIVSADGAPVLIDLLDFSPTDDGDIVSTAYAPSKGGRMERDRFAVTRIVEELAACAPLEPVIAGKLAEAIQTCRAGPPENGTLLPLIDALERALNPPAAEAALAFALGIPRAPVGPLLPDEGQFHVRRARRGDGFVVRGACEELDIHLDTAGRPLWARRVSIDQKRIGRLSRHEFMAFRGELSVARSDISDLSPLLALMEAPEFVAGWTREEAEPAVEAQVEDSADAGGPPAYDDLAFDRMSDEQPAAGVLPPVDVPRLWRALIETERELTTDGVAQADSGFNRDTRRHIVPFELTSGTFDFNRTDRVAVERLDRKGAWRRIGELDIGRSRPDRVVIDASETVLPHQRGLVEADQRLRFTSHLQVQSLKRRESATNLILSGQACIEGLSEIFGSDTDIEPQKRSIQVDDEALEPYGLNPAQKAAFRRIVTTRPLGALQGPPGTGKTRFIGALAHYALTRGLVQNILLASQSHEAVNNAAEAVLRLFEGQKETPSMLRVGNEGVVSDRLMPYYTDRLEQFYKDRFRAEARDRLRRIGQVLGLAPAVVEAVITAETTLRPVAEAIDRLNAEAEADPARIKALVATLEAQLAGMGPIGADVVVDEDDPLGVLDEVISEATLALPLGARPAPERIARFQSVAQLGRDFVGSVSTQQRGYEAFLAGTRQIVAGTCVGLGRPGLGLTNTPFDLVIIDEAARCTASELAVPMQAGRWVVLVGDHEQLPPHHEPSVVEDVAKKVGIDPEEVMRSDFERLFGNAYGASAGAQLTMQYRMLPPIGKVVSDAFYKGRLEPGRTKPEIEPKLLPPGLEKPITWISTDGLRERGAERREETGTSRVNPSEADAIVSLLRAWSKHGAFVAWSAEQTKHAHVIGVICMYAAQADLIRRKVLAANLPEALRRRIKIDTVDSYQGKENPIVILSLVRNNADGPTQDGLKTIRTGFLKQPNRVNVAVSRAMDRLVIVGAKNRWPRGSAMHRLAEAVELQFGDGEAAVVPAASLSDAPVAVGA